MLEYGTGRGSRDAKKTTTYHEEPRRTDTIDWTWHPISDSGEPIHEDDDSEYDDEVESIKSYWGTSVFGIDVDGDGDVDVLTSSYVDNTVAWDENVDGRGGSWVSRSISASSDGPFSIFGIDVDNDTDTDVVSVSFNDGTIGWYENADGRGGLWVYRGITDKLVGLSSMFAHVGIFAIDVDGDGDVDLLTAEYVRAVYGKATIVWFENRLNSGQRWLMHEITSLARWTTSVHGVDMDGETRTQPR